MPYTHQGADGSRHAGPGGLLGCDLCDAAEPGPYEDPYAPGTVDRAVLSQGLIPYSTQTPGSDHAMAPAMLPVLAERGYRPQYPSLPGSFHREGCPGGGSVGFGFQPDGTAIIVRTDSHGFWMGHPETIPAGTPAAKITAKLAALETMAEDHRKCCGTGGD